MKKPSDRPVEAVQADIEQAVIQAQVAFRRAHLWNEPTAHDIIRGSKRAMLYALQVLVEEVFMIVTSARLKEMSFADFRTWMTADGGAADTALRWACWLAAEAGSQCPATWQTALRSHIERDLIRKAEFSWWRAAENTGGNAAVDLTIGFIEQNANGRSVKVESGAGKTEPAEAKSPKTPNTATGLRIDAFIEMVFRDSGERIKKQDIQLVANQKTRTEFQRYQREDPLTTANGRKAFERVLAMSTRDFLAALERRRRSSPPSK